MGWLFERFCFSVCHLLRAFESVLLFSPRVGETTLSLGIRNRRIPLCAHLLTVEGRRMYFFLNVLPCRPLMDNNEACLWHFRFVIQTEHGGSWPPSTAWFLGSGWCDQGPVGQLVQYGAGRRVFLKEKQKFGPQD